MDVQRDRNNEYKEQGEDVNGKVLSRSDGKGANSFHDCPLSGLQLFSNNKTNISDISDLAFHHSIISGKS